MVDFGVNIAKMYTGTSLPISYATLDTTKGKIVIKLFSDHAPKTVANFVELAAGMREWIDPKTNTKTKRPLYDRTIFHRVISGFMIQGGDPLGNGSGGPGYNFPDEFHPDLAFDKPYLVAMANAGPNTNGSQFFITVAPTPWLNQKHTIFGEVEDSYSQKVVDKIVAVKTGLNDKPIKNVVVRSVKITRQVSANDDLLIIEFKEIDADSNSIIAGKYNVGRVPVMILIDNDKETEIGRSDIFIKDYII